MQTIVTNIIFSVNEWILNNGQEEECIFEDLNSVSLPVWDEMSDEVKLATLLYINEKRLDDDLDFTHSGCCTAECQAAAAFCVEFFKGQDLLSALFADLDFMMESNVRQNPFVQEMLDINPNF